ncbi:hypothetical protein QBC36DRAFT_318414 [Triangularia setosa]|uniref:Uncharacterized protein n=1 Tax=Triangularia setosa TaxID=2587417 RepID=A0AAN6WFQ1_9PEZI|nr:hypothetical protein QBC36DRAFT_318414 [Podospora setosa]
MTAAILAAIIQGAMSTPAVNVTSEPVDAMTELLARRQAVRGEWGCQLFVAGPGHDALRADHAAYNRIFGGPASPHAADSATLGGATGATLLGVTWLQTRVPSMPISKALSRIPTPIGGSTAHMTTCLVGSGTGGIRGRCGVERRG